MTKATIRGLLFLVCGGFMHLLQATTIDVATRYTELRTRFPELELPEGTPTFHVATNRAELQSAITTALNAAGDDVILLDGRTSQTWEGSSAITLSGTAANGSVFIVSQNPETGAFTQPVTFKGFGLAIGNQNAAPIYVANFAITESTTYPSFHYSAGISAMGSGAVKGSCLSITNCGNTTSSRGGGLYNIGPNITLYNTTIADTKTFLYGAVTNLGGTVTLVHCTIAGNTNTTTGVTTGGTSTITTTNCWITTDTLPITSIDTAVPHCVPTASSGALNTATETPSVTITYDVLGNARISYDTADKGAVEYLEVAVVEPPTVVALPSGPREVYLGWSVIASALDYQLERSTDSGASWTDITAKTLWRTPRDETTNPEGTVLGWTSARYLEATPGETAQYRLSFAVAGGGSERVFAEPKTITSPALDVYPLYHSRPGAQRVIYLDFTGYVDDYAGSVRSAQAAFENQDLTYIKTAPFEYNGRFGDLTQPYPTASAIYDIWRMVAEDFAAFDVDVTTEAPTYDALVKSSEEDMAYGKRVVIGYAVGTSDPWYIGGGAFSGGGSFGFQHDRPVYIFSVQSRQNIAAQVTHEVSHTLGLAHDPGRIYFWDTFLTTSDYYCGVEITPDGVLNETGYTKTGITWYPVMGGAPTATSYSGYYYDSDDFMNQWNNGTYSSAGNKEDDFAILLGLQEGSGTAFTDKPLLYSAAARNITLAEDDAGDTLDTAQALGSLQEESPLTATAVIGKHVQDSTVTNDVDLFNVIATTTGELRVSVVPNFRGLTEGASLDAQVEVLDANGQRMALATEPQWDANEVYFDDLRNAVCTALLPAAGTYYVRVSGTNHPVSSTTLSPDGSASQNTPWYFNATDNNGSIGPYTLTASFTEQEVEIVGDPYYTLLDNDIWGWRNNRLPANGDNLTLDFADTSDHSIDLATLLGSVSQLATVTIQGTNGGTLTNTDGITADVWSIYSGTTTALEIQGALTGSAQVKLLSGKAQLSETNSYTGGTDIAANATLTITHNQALGTTGNITGAGTLICDGVIPANKNGLTLETWTGTVGLKAAFGDNADLTPYGNAASTIHFMQGATANYLAQAKTIASAFILDGTITHNNGWSSNGGQIFSGGFSGSGTLITSNSPTDVIQITGENINFTGTLTVNGGHCVAFGSQADDNNQTGKIVINKIGITLASGKTWSAQNGTNITQNGALVVNGTLTGAIINNGSLNYCVDSIPTNTYSGAGSIGVDATTLNLTQANLTNYTGSFTLANRGTLILPAGKETGITVGTGCTLKLNLAPDQLASPYTSQATLNGGQVIFTQNNGATEITEEVSNGTYTPTIEAVTWENGAWSQQPVTGSPVTITFSEGNTTCTFTNTEAITLGSLKIAGDTAGTLVFSGAAVTVGSMTIEPATVTIPASLLNGITATPYTIAQGKTLILSGDATVSKTTHVYGTLALEGSMSFTGDNIVYDGGRLEVRSGTTTFNTGDGRGFQNGCTVKVATGATLKNGKADAPGYGNVTFDIAGTLEVTNGVRWSLGANSQVILRDGARLLGDGVNDTHQYAYDWFDGATIQALGDAEILGNIGTHKADDNELNFNIAANKTLTLSGLVKKGKLKVSGAGTMKLTGANPYTGGTDIAEGSTLTIMTNAGALGSGAITGVGKLVCNGILPTNKTGLTTGTATSGWRGTVKLDDMAAQDELKDLNLSFYGNANSTIELGTLGSESTDKLYFPNETVDIPSDIVISGTVTIRNGYADGVYNFTGDFSGNGTLTFPYTDRSISTWNISGDFTGFTGTLNLPNRTKASATAKIIFRSDSTTTETFTNGMTVADGYTLKVNATYPHAIKVLGTIQQGTGSLSSLTLSNGATIDATAKALTVNGAVTLPETGAVTVQASQYGEVLNATNLTADAFSLASGTNGLLIATADALVYTAAPALPEGANNLSKTTLQLLAELAVAEGVLQVSLEGAELPSLQKTVDIAGFELFNDVTTITKGENNTGTAVVSYAFGIGDITVTADRKLQVTATIDALQAQSPKPTFIKGVRVDLYHGDTYIGSQRVSEGNCSTLILTTEETLDAILGQTETVLDLTVKVSNEPQPSL